MQPDPQSSPASNKKSTNHWLGPIIILLTLVLLVTLFYIEENWRGKRAWGRVQAQLQAKGEILEWSHYLQPPPSDDQNLMKFPGMADYFIKGRSSLIRVPTTPSLTKNSTNEMRYGEVQFVTHTQSTNFPANTPLFDYDELQHNPSTRKDLSSNFWGRSLATPTAGYLTAITPGTQVTRVYIKTPLTNSLQLSNALATPDLLLEARPARIEQIAPTTFAFYTPLEKRLSAEDYIKWSSAAHAEFLTMLDGAFQRPECWLPGDYSIPFFVPIPDFVRVRTTAQMLMTRAQAFILLGRADEAFREIQRVENLKRIMLTEPMTLVSAMIQVAITGLQTQTITEGFSLGVWQEKHWRAFIKNSAKTRLLPPVIDSLRSGERAGILRLIETITEDDLPKILAATQQDPTIKSLATSLKMMPRGWVDQNLASYCQLIQQNIDLFETDQPADPKQMQITTDAIIADLQQRSPFRIVAQIGLPNLLKAVQTSLKNQTYLHETAIASALELYRQKNGTYPDTLQSLSPTYLDTIPADLILGRPLRYQKRNHEYALYSIGWDTVDDLAPLLTNPNTPMREILSSKPAEKDWIWPGIPP